MKNQSGFKKLADDIAEIKAALIGDPMEGKTGIMQGHRRLMQDMYGEDSHGNIIEGSEKNTILHRLSKSEDDKKKVFWIATGVMGLWALLKHGFASTWDWFTKNK